ncbi:MAG TPA: SDR family NAD(P)-dependent oxidoreductase [Candidatus Sulfotelmatobacter sp.]|nr:SDR family NAD(P)-dependent oxidoreductase [Candidatus Sulfotelmatobacter sp.]
MFDFGGKVLLLTGANGGITRAVARLFRQLGASLVLSDLNENGLAAFGAELDETGEHVVTLKGDATRSADSEAAVTLARERFGGIDFLVTGAGLYLDQLVGTMTDEQWRQSIAVNLDGVFYSCRAAAKALREGGAIVNIASMAGHRGSYQHAHYAAAKGAVLSFTRSLAVELAPRVRVNAVSPGLIDTPMVVPLLEARGPQLLDQTPLKRLGTPEEVARTIAFLCSDWASFITGETVHINGGLYIAS